MGQPKHPVILSAPLTYLPKARLSVRNGQQVHCTLTLETFTWHHHTLRLHDLLGITPQPGGFILHTCSLRQRDLWQRPRRTLQSHAFKCSTSAQQQEWHQALTVALNQTRTTPPLRHLLVILNPQSGQKRARHCWQTVEPLFQHCGIQCTVLQAGSQAQLQTTLHTQALGAYDGLVVVGGDGTVHEVLNSLHQRPDRDAALQLPIGIIPTGTGNGLCKSLLAQTGDPFDWISAAFAIAKGQPQAVDWLQVQQAQVQRYGLLSLAWGLISDIDLESERFRWLGPLRNDLYALFCILWLRSYRGTLEFQQQEKGPWHSISGTWIALWILNVPWATQTVMAAPQAQLADGYMDVLWVQAGISRWDLLRAFMGLADGHHLRFEQIESVKAVRLRFIPELDQGKLSLDGEDIPCTATELSIQPRKGRLFGLSTSTANHGHLHQP